MYTLAELAEILGLTLAGDARQPISGLASLRAAGPEDLSFLSNEQHLSTLQQTRAAAVILSPQHASEHSGSALIAADPYLSFAQASRLFDSGTKAAPGIHAAACVSASASVHASACVAANAVVQGDAHIEEGAIVGAGVYVGEGSCIGKHTVLHPGAVVHHGVRIGSHCIVHSQAVIGGDGFGFALNETSGAKTWEKIHQLGGVTIGDRVEIGACTTVDRGTLDDTEIADGVIIDNQVQIAHNCRVGKNTAIAGCVGIAGSTVIGANCTLAGGVGIVGHVEICDNVHVTGMTMVTHSIREPGSYSSGTAMGNTPAWRRNAVRFSQLDDLNRRVRLLEKQVEEALGSAQENTQENADE